MKKIKILSTIILIVLFLTSCKGSDNQITAVVREEGSGTRDSFASVFLTDVHSYTPKAEVVNSTAALITSVAGYKNAIGYISLGFLNDSVKAVSVNGVYPTPETIRNGEYEATRVLYLVDSNKTNLLANDFLKFVLSSKGQTEVEKNGYISSPELSDYAFKNLSGTLTLAGSTSVAPIIEILAEEYKLFNPETEIEIQQIGSSAGIQAAKENICDLAMSSRPLTDEEKASGLQENKIATDGIVVIVNNQNPVFNLTSKQIKNIFEGSQTIWTAERKENENF